MSRVAALLDGLPDHARDLRLNVASLLGEGGALEAHRRYGVALAAACASPHAGLRDALAADAADAGAAPGVLEDARTAAALMAMNNVYYRFRHQIGKESYAGKPARLRMTRLGAARSEKVDLELYSLAVSAINGCEFCVRAHEEAVLKGGLGEDHVHDAVRLAAAVHAASRALA
ncbi:MAG TPA: carboxymuconolactone decarboxylase family protein [Planctomycetota bacterium]|nr:carboxymuconolactone decarboxylase family protein [Planctomycetota bacterium]